MLKEEDYPLTDKALQDVIKEFKKIGAACHKKKGVYECQLLSAIAEIDETFRKIKIRVPVEFRTEFLKFDEVIREDEKMWLTDTEFFDEATRISKAKVYIDFPPEEPRLIFEYKFENLQDALRTFKNIAIKDLYIALTNIDAELRCYSEGAKIRCEQWLKDLA